MAGRLTIDDDFHVVPGGVTVAGNILSDTTIVVGSVNAKAVAIVDGSGNQAGISTNPIVTSPVSSTSLVSGVTGATDTTSTSLISAPTSNLRNYITQVTVWNSSAVSTYIKLQDGSGGTEIYDIPAPAGGGAVVSFPTPLKQPTTATALYFAANASANAIRISASGYTGA